MSLRDGQERVEIRPGVFVWLGGDDLANFRASSGKSAPKPITSAALAAPESAVIDTPKARKPK